MTRVAPSVWSDLAMVDQLAAVNALAETRLRSGGVGGIRLSVAGIVQGHRLKGTRHIRRASRGQHIMKRALV